MRSLAALLLALLALPARADSPLTSCELSTGYGELSVLARLQRGKATDDAVAFLLGDHPLDHKVAVAHALGSRADRDRSPTHALVGALAARRPVPLGALSPSALSPEERALLGYLMALEELETLQPFGVSKALGALTPRKLLAGAVRERPRVFTIAYLSALIEAQALIGRQDRWCEIYTAPAALLARFPESQRDLRPSAVAQCQDYLDEYRDSCAHLKPPPEEAEELDQIYALGLVGGTMVVGTQGGVVALDVPSGERRAVAPDFICADVVTVGAQALVGCRRGLYLYEGGALRKLATRPDRGEHGVELLARPGAAPLVIDGARAWTWDGRALVPAAEVPARGAYARLLRRRDGVLWSIDFGTAVRAGARVLAVGKDYPGRDPRRLMEDANGDLWVMDFESGALRYDDVSRAFVSSGPAAQASAVVVDVRAGARVYLHYRQGLIIDGGGSTRAIPIPGQDYLRDLLLGADGTLWIGGWHGLTAVPPSGPQRTYSLRGRR